MYVSRGARRGGGGLLGRLRLGCECESRKTFLGQDLVTEVPAVGSQAVPGQSIDVPAGNYTTAQLVQEDAAQTGYTQAQLTQMWASPDTPLSLNPATGVPYGRSPSTAGAGYGGSFSLPATLQVAGATIGLNQPPSTAPSSSTSSLLLLGGLGLVAVMLLSGGKKRR